MIRLEIEEYFGTYKSYLPITFNVIILPQIRSEQGFSANLRTEFLQELIS